MSFPTPNADEGLVTDGAPFIGNFHKTLQHNEFGEVLAADYRVFERTCLAVEAGAPINFEQVPAGGAPTPGQTPFTARAKALGLDQAAKFTSPLAGAATEVHGPDPKAMEMPAAPGCQSISAMAEMAELYWMALLRDAPLLAFQQQTGPATAGNALLSEHDAALGYNLAARVGAARKAVNLLFDCAVTRDTDAGKLRAPLDLEAGPGGANVGLQHLFRSGLHDEEHGPLISQFFIRPVGYGVQTIDQKQVPYIARRDFLTNHGDWLLAQNTGKDKHGRDYPNCNHYADQLSDPTASYYPMVAGAPVKRYIATMRDLARFVNRDALHQAYFNAALFLDGAGARLDAGNPYRGRRFTREGAFASLGGPDLLTLVSEVASRALKVVWRQKWLVHRRCRPEVFGGLLQMQVNGYNGTLRDYGLPMDMLGSAACKQALADTLDAVTAHNRALNGGGANDGTLFLPMAFSAGSPSHPAYGAGHATVAGACVAVLKAWFDEDQTLAELFKTNNDAAAAGKAPKEPTAGVLQILQPGHRVAGGGLDDFHDPAPYTGADAQRMTVGGELNKIASNVAMGRSMGGVHWRSDNTRSLRLGEQIAIEILRKRTAEYAERPVSFSFRSFDRQPVHITQGQVRVG